MLVALSLLSRRSFIGHSHFKKKVIVSRKIIERFIWCNLYKIIKLFVTFTFSLHTH